MSANIPEFFRHLQWLQDQHDSNYHGDIYTMSRSDNITHMVMHMVKYIGKLVAVAPAVTVEDRERFAGEYTPVLVDFMIVLMSSANRMNINLGERLPDLCKHTDEWTVYHGFFPNPESVEVALRAGMPLLRPALGETLVLGQLRPLIEGMGLMSKALEALDHMESYPSRQVLNEQIVLMFQQVLRLYHHYCQRPFYDSIKGRMVQIEKASFMYDERPKYLHDFTPNV